jgi:hypothetical protein
VRGAQAVGQRELATPGEHRDELLCAHDGVEYQVVHLLVENLLNRLII